MTSLLCRTTARASAGSYQIPSAPDILPHTYDLPLADAEVDASGRDLTIKTETSLAELGLQGEQARRL
jgi:hypothetical protein